MKKHTLAVALATSLLATSLSAVEVSLEEKLSGLYVSFFNRAADSDGLAYWTKLGNAAEARGENVSDTLKQLSAGFATHPTFTSTYSSMGEEDFVQAIYQNSLGKPGDSQGVAYWTGLLNDGKSRSDMVAEFIELSLTLDLTPENFPELTSEELAAAVERQNLISNKVDVAVYFTKNLGTLTNVVDVLDPENDPAYLASIEVLRGVTVDESTVSTATGRMMGILNDSNAIALINNSWSGLHVDTGAMTYALADYSWIVIYNNINDLIATSMQSAYTSYSGFQSVASVATVSCADYGFTDLAYSSSAAGYTVNTYMTSDFLRTCTEADFAGVAGLGGTSNIVYNYNIN